MTVKELEKADKNLKLMITKCANDNNLITEDIKPIYDGIYSAELYLESPLKIMWILKEAYDDVDNKNNPVGGDWSITENIFDEPDKNIINNRTLEMVAYISYGILNNILWNKMDYIADTPEIAKSVQQIAYININKMPAYTTTDDSKLNGHYHIWKDVLLKQIEVYNPDVMIFGNTYCYFENDLTGRYKTLSKAHKINVYEYNDNQLIIDAYHPGNRISDYKEVYVNTIVKSVNKWLSDNDKNTMEYKYNFIKNLAKYLVDNKLKMTGLEVAELMNSNEIYTSYGTEYAGRRGTYKLISDSYKYFENEGNNEVAENIAIAFIKADGSYAYEN